jgi:hypothetical protein
MDDEQVAEMLLTQYEERANQIAAKNAMIAAMKKGIAASDEKMASNDKLIAARKNLTVEMLVLQLLLKGDQNRRIEQLTLLYKEVTLLIKEQAAAEKERTDRAIEDPKRTLEGLRADKERIEKLEFAKGLSVCYSFGLYAYMLWKDRSR